MNNILTGLSLTLLLLVSASQALANGLTPSMTATEVHDSSQPKANKVIEYNLHFTNSMHEIFNDPLVVTGPIPPGTKFVPKSHNSTVLATYEVSYDNGKSYRPAHTISEHITHIRWKIEGKSLPSGQSWIFKYRVLVTN